MDTEDQLPKMQLTGSLMHLIADRVYQANVGSLEKIREEWQNEHVKACEVSEALMIQPPGLGG